MTEENRNTQDESGVADDARVVVKGPDGGIAHASGVKGPDPAEWGGDADRPDPFAGLENAGAEPVPLGEIRSEDLAGRPKGELLDLAGMHGIAGRSSMSARRLADVLQERGVGVTKGPGPQWETDENGRYTNR